MQESIVFLVRVQCRRKESSRSLSHLLMSFLYFLHQLRQNFYGLTEIIIGTLQYSSVTLHAVSKCPRETQHKPTSTSRLIIFTSAIIAALHMA